MNKQELLRICRTKCHKLTKRPKAKSNYPNISQHNFYQSTIPLPYSTRDANQINTVYGW